MYGVLHFKNKITIFYFLEYNLFNQPRNHFLIIGDLSMTGLVGYKPSRFGSGFLLTAWKDKHYQRLVLPVENTAELLEGNKVRVLG